MAGDAFFGKKAARDALATLDSEAEFEEALALMDTALKRPLADALTWETLWPAGPNSSPRPTRSEPAPSRIRPPSPNANPASPPGFLQPARDG